MNLFCFGKRYVVLNFWQGQRCCNKNLEKVRVPWLRLPNRSYQCYWLCLIVFYSHEHFGDEAKRSKDVSFNITQKIRKKLEGISVLSVLHETKLGIWLLEEAIKSMSGVKNVLQIYQSCLDQTSIQFHGRNFLRVDLHSYFPWYWGSHWSDTLRHSPQQNTPSSCIRCMIYSHLVY